MSAQLKLSIAFSTLWILFIAHCWVSFDCIETKSCSAWTADRCRQSKVGLDPFKNKYCYHDPKQDLFRSCYEICHSELYSERALCDEKCAEGKCMNLYGSSYLIGYGDVR